MELLNNETVQNYSLEGEVIKGEVKVRNGLIEKCVVETTAGGVCYEYGFCEQEIRELHKEFGLLLSAIDKQKGVGNV